MTSPLSFFLSSRCHCSKSLVFHSHFVKFLCPHGCLRYNRTFQILLDGVLLWRAVKSKSWGEINHFPDSIDCSHLWPVQLFPCRTLVPLETSLDTHPSCSSPATPGGCRTLACTSLPAASRAH